MITMYFAGNFGIHLFLHSDALVETPENAFRFFTVGAMVEAYEANPEYIDEVTLYSGGEVHGAPGINFLIWLQDKISENPDYPFPKTLTVRTEFPEVMREMDRLMISIAELRKRDEKG